MLLQSVRKLPVFALLLGLSSCLYTVDETTSLNLLSYADSVRAQNAAASAPESDSFLALLEKLEEIGYYQQKQDCAYPLDSGYCCLIPPTENTLNKAIEAVNLAVNIANNSSSSFEALEKPISPLNLEGLLEIKSSLLGANQELQKNLYPGAIVEEWTFDEISSAEKVAEQLSRFSAFEWSSLSSAPVSWWKKDYKLYFIYPTGNSVLSEMPKLQQKMQENL